MTVTADDVGRRVTVRYRLADDGGPGATDVVGVLQAWTTSEWVVQRRDGTTVAVAAADVIVSKVVS